MLNLRRNRALPFLRWLARVLVISTLLFLVATYANVWKFTKVKATISDSPSQRIQGQRAEEPRDSVPKVKATVKPSYVKAVKITKDLNTITDPDERKEYVKQMMIHAWDGYKKYAWGSQELDPINNGPRGGALFGNIKLGLTLVDGLSTLKIMGLEKRFEDGRDWVAENFKHSAFPGSASVFEWNIRYVGGLLSAYALSKDEMFKEKAKLAADYLLPAFSSPSGIPYGTVRKGGRTFGGGHAILSEMGTLHLEFEYLSFITKNPDYAKKVRKIRDVLRQKPKTDGLYPSDIMPDNPNADMGSGKISLGALSDSFYEYLLKTWIMSGKKDEVAKKMYVDSVKALEKKGVIAKGSDGMWFAGELRLPGRGFAPYMDHFACFAGGMLAAQGAMLEVTEEMKTKYLNMGKGMGKACHEGYRKTGTGLGPDQITFAGNNVSPGGGFYQRPEAVETWFYLWRLTKDPMYREWCWDYIKALEKHVKTGSGYTGLNNVQDANSKDYAMQSFFLGETLKYLYLIYTDDSVIPLDKWVFNTEAHPLPVIDFVKTD